MEQPSLSDAPLGWLKAAVEDTQQDVDEKEVSFTIRSAKDDSAHEFSLTVGQIREELRRRESN